MDLSTIEKKEKACYLSYTEIGASVFNNSRFDLLLRGGCFCCFKFGCV